MKKIQFACLLAVLAAVVSFSSSAEAQIRNQKYASAAGSGTACSASAPCDLVEAIADASAGGADGMVSCIDGGFSENNFQFSNNVAIDCPGAVLTATGGSPSIVLNGNSQRVILRNLTFDGASDILSAPLIKVTGGVASLIIENCKFQNLDFINGSSIGNGVTIQFLPNRPASQLIIRDSLFADNGVGGSSGGLEVAPAAGGSASVVLERVSFNFNATSMALLGPVNATMVNSTVSASRSNGILVGSGATLDIKDSTLVYNVGAAVDVASGGTLRYRTPTSRATKSVSPTTGDRRCPTRTTVSWVTARPQRSARSQADNRKQNGPDCLNGGRPGRAASLFCDGASTRDASLLGTSEAIRLKPPPRSVAASRFHMRSAP